MSFVFIRTFSIAATRHDNTCVKFFTRQKLIVYESTKYHLTSNLPTDGKDSWMEFIGILSVNVRPQEHTNTGSHSAGDDIIKLKTRDSCKYVEDVKAPENDVHSNSMA